MFVVVVDFEIHKTHRTDFLAAVKQQSYDSLNLEAGCLRFDVCIDNDERGKILLYEIYASDSEFQKHLNTAHFEAFDRITKPMVRIKRVRTMTLHAGGE